MKRLFYIFAIVSVRAFSQEISENDPVNQMYLPKAKYNTIENLTKYKGIHVAKSVEEYKFINDDWTLVASDTTLAEINYNNYYLTFKRSYFRDPLVRYILFDGYNEKDNYYFYESYYGNVHIYGGFKTVVLFDNPGKNGKPTNKYIFNF